MQSFLSFGFAVSVHVSAHTPFGLEVVVTASMQCRPRRIYTDIRVSSTTRSLRAKPQALYTSLQTPAIPLKNEGGFCTEAYTSLSMSTDLISLANFISTID